MKILKAECVLNQRTIIKVKLEHGTIICIKYSDIRDRWSYARQADIECSGCVVFGKYVVFVLCTAQGQGGVICVWDCEKNKLEHITEAGYCISFLLTEDYLYMLHEISYYGMPSHYRVSRVPFGIIDSKKEAEMLYADKPEKIKTAEGFTIRGKSLYVKSDGEEVLFANDISKANKPKREYKYLYDTPSWGDKDYRDKVMKRDGMIF